MQNKNYSMSVLLHYSSMFLHTPGFPSSSSYWYYSICFAVCLHSLAQAGLDESKIRTFGNAAYILRKDVIPATRNEAYGVLHNTDTRGRCQRREIHVDIHCHCYSGTGYVNALTESDRDYVSVS